MNTGWKSYDVPSGDKGMRTGWESYNVPCGAIDTSTDRESYDVSCGDTDIRKLTQSLREGHKPRKCGAAARYYTTHTKTMLPTRKSVPRSIRQSDHTKTS